MRADMMRAMIRRLAFALVAAVVWPLMLAQAAVAAEPIKLGILLTYVGPTASFARYEDKGARLLIDEVNAAGGINGRQIQIVNYDTEGKPDRAGILFRRLADDDKVAAVIGPESIYVVLGMSAVPAQVKVMEVSAAGAYELVEPKDRSYIVSAQASHGYSNALVLAYLKDKLKVSRIGILTTADSIGDITAQKYTSAARLAGVEVAKVVSQPASDRDLLPSLRQLADVKPAIDGLMIFGSGPFADIALNQTELAGLSVPVGYSGGNIIPELIKDVSAAAGKRFFLAAPRATVADTLPKSDPYKAAIDKFVGDYVAKYHEQPALPSMTGYDMALTIIDAIKAIGPAPQKIRDYIYNKQKNLVGMQGVRFNRSEGDGYGVDPREDVIASIEGGKFVFKGYLRDSLDHLGITDAAIRGEFKKFKIILQ
jgi:branched-chain amino acid transport system substrate-binding protein